MRMLVCVFMCVCVCVSTPKLLKTIHMKWSLNNQLNKFYCFPVLYMTNGIDIANGRGLSNEVHRELLPNKTKITLY